MLDGMAVHADETSLRMHLYRKSNNEVVFVMLCLNQCHLHVCRYFAERAISEEVSRKDLESVLFPDSTQKLPF